MTTTSNSDHLLAFEKPVPGRWLLSLPFVPASISVRRYICPSRIPVPAAESSADAVRRAALEAVLRSGEDDGLEKAWRAINGIGANEADVAVGDVLRTPCAIITSVKDAERQLWVFEVRGPNGSTKDQYHNEALDGLTPVEEGSLLFDITELLSCPTHGHNSSCITAASSSACDVVWKPGKLARPWGLLSSAVVEKLAWRNGRRICMDARSKEITARISLRPFANQHLLLSVNAVQPSISAIAHKTQDSVLLLPARTPAVHLSSFDPTPPQSGHLKWSFATLLGPAWAATQSPPSILEGPSGGPSWAVYWVSTSPDSGTDGRINGERGNGVLVVWPSSLVLRNHPTPPDSRSASRKRNIATIHDAPAPEELMGIASSLFDFLSTYSEPPPPDSPPQPEMATSASGDFPTPQTGPREPESSPVAPAETEAQADAMEEEDDLFSSTPSSPAPPPDNPFASDDMGLQDEVIPGTADDFDDLFGESGEEENPVQVAPVMLTQDIEMGSPGRPYAELADDLYEPYDAADEITADDFAFLDSPAKAGADTGGSGKSAGDATTLEAETRSELPGVSNGDAESSSQAEPSTDLAVELFEPPTSAISTLSNVVDTSNTAALVETDKPDLSSISPTSSFELIPSPFAPLDISRPIGMSSPIHHFPTPAPTPEAHGLREDLVERLRQAKRQKGDGDYTSAWLIEDDISETEEGFDDSGAPPTPMSEGESDEGDDGASGRSTRGGDGEVAESSVDWRGTRCLGAEMIWMKDDHRIWDAVSCAWNAEWAAGDVAQPTTLPSPPASPVARARPLDPEIDLDRLAVEIVANKHFRQALSSKTAIALGQNPDLGTLTTTGSTLTDLLSSNSHLPHQDGQSTSRALGSCNIHAGFGGNVMRLSVAGTKYWRQLGLSPVGGEKEVTGVVLTSPGEGAKRDAEGFLSGIQAVWGQYRLGTHTTTERGVVQSAMASSAELSGSIGKIIRSCESGTNLVIYLLLDSVDETSVTLSLLSHPLPESSILHVIFTSSIQSRQIPEIAFEVYNRIPRLLRQITSASPQPPVYLQYPSFTLVPDKTPTPALTLKWPLVSYDVFNRWRYVHAAYTHDDRSGIAVAFVIDAEGDNYEVRTFRTKGRQIGDWLRSIWEFLTEFAGRAAIEWRMSLTRAGGGMKKEEVDGWKEIIRGAHVTLLVVEPIHLSGSTSTSTVAAPAPAPVLSDPSARITDDTLAARTWTHPQRCPLLLSSDGEDTTTIYPLLSFVLSVAGSPAISGNGVVTYHLLSHRSAPGKEDEKVDEVLSREFQKLVYLGRLRFGFEGGAVGVHVASVLAVAEAIGEVVL